MNIIKLFTIFSLLIFSNTVQASDKVLDIQEIKTPAGITAWLVEDHSLPIISMSFSFAGGVSQDPKDKSGRAQMVSILLDEGAGDLNSQTFQKTLSDNSISMRFSARRDYFTGQVKTLVKNKDKAFELLTLALTKPSFEADAIERMKNSTVSSIKRSLGNPSWIVARTFNGIAFEGHPYASPGSGNLKSIPNITTDDLREFTDKTFNQASLKIAVSGDITKSELQKLIDKTFATLPKGKAPSKGAFTKLQNTPKTYLYEIDTPQTFISIGHDNLSRDNPDWYAVQLVNYILGGGGFSSRLMTEIRVKRGLTYGVYSSLNEQNYASIWQASMSTKNESAKLSLELIEQEWRKMAEHGPTADELKYAKAYLTGALPLQLTSTGSIAGTLNSLQRQKRDINYINNLNDKINAVTLEQAKQAAKTWLNPDHRLTVLVGKPKDVAADITLTTLPGM